MSNLAVHVYEYRGVTIEVFPYEDSLCVRVLHAGTGAGVREKHHRQRAASSTSTMLSIGCDDMMRAYCPRRATKRWQEGAPESHERIRWLDLPEHIRKHVISRAETDE